MSFKIIDEDIVITKTLIHELMNEVGTKTGFDYMPYNEDENCLGNLKGFIYSLVDSAYNKGYLQGVSECD
jgi:hypothetical protein